MDAGLKRGVESRWKCAPSPRGRGGRTGPIRNYLLKLKETPLMPSNRRWIIPCVFALLVGPACPAAAQNEGQDQLDRATETKLNAKTMQDLNRVCELIDSAMEKGLDEANTQFARQLLGATLLQRGMLKGKVALRLGTKHSQFGALRTDALDDLRRGLKHTTGQPETLLMVARLNVLAGGDVEKAKEALQKARAMPIDDPRLRAKLLTLQAALIEDAAKKRALLNEAVRAAPNSTAALRTRGLLRADRGEFEQALKDFNRALDIEPEHSATLRAKALVLRQLKRYDEALATLEEIERLNPRALGPLLEKARLHLLQDRHEAALKELDRAIQREPENLRVLLLRAGVYEEAGKRSEAMADLDRALRLEPGFPPAVRLRATLLADGEKIDEAIAELQRLKQSGPSDPLTLLQLGMLLTSARKHAEAAKIYDDLLQLQPENGMALRGRADALLNLGRHRAAIADYKKALTVKPDAVGVLNNLAWVLATSPKEKLRDGRRAVELATKASELTDHQQAHILSTLAAAYAETGDFPKALEWIDKALEVADEDQRKPLSKERKSYERGKPWRELLGQGGKSEDNDE